MAGISVIATMLSPENKSTQTSRIYNSLKPLVLLIFRISNYFLKIYFCMYLIYKYF